MDKDQQIFRITIVFSIIFVLIFASSIGIGQEEEEDDEEEGMEEFVELSGYLNYILFGLAVLILPWKYLYKTIRNRLKKRGRPRTILNNLNKILNWFHYIIGLGAVFIISYHAYITLSEWNIFLFVGLLLIWIYLFSGILFYIKSLPGNLKKWLYRLHGNKIFLVITAAILLVGHLMYD